MLLRAISLPGHGALELTIALAVALLPFALGLGPAATAVGVALGAVLAGLALGAAATEITASGRPSSLPVAAHAAYDKAIAVALIAVGAGGALAGNPPALVFVALGAAHAALIAATRYTRAA